MQRVMAEAETRQATAVNRVQVRIGTISGVEVELLQTAYDIVRDGTLCANAPLEVTRVAGDDIVLERLELEVGDV